MRFLIVFLLLICSVVTQASGPSVRFFKLSIEQGLSQNSINSIIQDNEGYIWIGTQDGVNRYDGYNFKIFRHDPQLPNSLLNNFINALFVFDSDQPV